MVVIVGCIVVMGCVLGGFTLSGGHVGALIHPAEILTIGGFPPEPNPDLDCLEPGSSPPHEAPSASAGNETEGDP